MEMRPFRQATRIAANAAVFVALVALAFITAVSALQTGGSTPAKIAVAGDGVVEIGTPYEISVTVEGLAEAEIAGWTVAWGDGAVDT
ncbi:MAG: hypothetical protein ACR2P0_16340, partial [Acidimicrobiales bacterium]